MSLNGLSIYRAQNKPRCYSGRFKINPGTPKVTVGSRWGTLTVIGEAPRDKHAHPRVYVKCDCGCEKMAQVNSLRAGSTKTCGLGVHRDGHSGNHHFKGRHDYDGAARSRLFFARKRACTKSGVEFNLTYDQFASITKQDCAYCGSKPSLIARRCGRSTKDGVIPVLGMCVYNGVDRKDSSAGYTVENSVPCCYQCNVSKAEMLPHEFMGWVAAVYHHNKLAPDSVAKGPFLRKFRYSGYASRIVKRPNGQEAVIHISRAEWRNRCARNVAASGC